MMPPAGHFPPRPPFPPGPPGPPNEPGPPRQPPAPAPVIQPTRVWPEPGGWPGRVYERLLDRRIVMASGQLDGETATRLCAQLLTLDAEGDEPIRLELQNLDADLSAALTVMGVLDVLRVPVHVQAGGRISGPALGVLASATRRLAYPNAMFALAEPKVSFDGRVTELAAREEQVRVMLDELYIRLAEVTGREVDDIRADARRERLLTVDDAISYGLIQGRAAR
ncbi:MAG: ATP-dependent Clp protease proteolytic subunit [Gemmatimonadota bacterium]